MEDHTVASAMQSTLPIEPFRGIKSFRYADRKIFAGREWETEQLLNLTSLYRGNLVFGQSGIGKSSLINAGLVPLLEENNFQAERIRVYPNPDYTFVVYRINNSDLTDSYLPSIFDRFIKPGCNSREISVSLEDFIDVVFENTYNENDAKTPVLIFDQFEELITLFEECGRKNSSETVMALSERKQLQIKIINLLRDCYYKAELRVKLLFIFREDYLAKFSRLFRAIPDLRDHSLRIKPILKDDILNIVECPFSKNLSELRYPDLFSGYLSKLIYEKLLEHFDEDEAVLTEIQIACQYIYETPVDSRNSLFFDPNGNPIEHPIRKIIQLFYERLLERLPENDKPLAVDILSLLVLNENTRNIFHSEAIVDELHSRHSVARIQSVLSRLDHDTRMVRCEIRKGGIYYEVSSESLVPYINELKNNKEKELEKIAIERQLEDEKKQKEELKKKIKEEEKIKERLKWVVIIGLTGLCFALVAFGYFEYQKSANRKAKIHLMAAKKSSSPTLSYAIANAAIGSSDNDKLLRYITSLKKNNNCYISNILFYPGTVSSVFIRHANSVGVVGNHSILFFNRAGFPVSEQLISDMVYANAKNDIIISKNFKTGANELRNFYGKLLATFYYNEAPRICAISNANNSFFVDGSIYRFGEQLPYATIMQPSFCQNLVAASFTENGEFLVVAYASGHIVVHNLNGLIIKGFKPTSYFSSITDFQIVGNSKIIFLEDESMVKSLKLEDLKLPTKNTISEQTFITNGRPDLLVNPGEHVKSIVFSKDQTRFITISNKIIIVWSADGIRLATMRLKAEGIIGAHLSAGNDQVVAYTEAGKIYVWTIGSLKDIQNDYAIFSPLDYRSAGLDESDMPGSVNQVKEVNKILPIALRYTASLHQTAMSLDENDDELDNVVKTSVTELHSLYDMLRQAANVDTFSNLAKKLLYKSYSIFIADSMTVARSEGRLGDEKDALASIWYWKELSVMTDTSDIIGAIDVARGYYHLGRSYIDSVNKKDYNEMVNYELRAVSVLEAFKQKYRDDSRINAELAYFYGTLAWYNLFIKNYQSSVFYANKGLNFGKEYDWIYTNLTLAFLLSGKTTEAESFYRQFSGRYYSNGLKSFKVAFLEDLDALEKAGVITTENEPLAKQVMKIRRMLR